MTYPHAQPPAAPVVDPRADPCGECTHFRSWHEGNAPKRPWESAPACTAWTPEGRCRCGGWEPKVEPEKVKPEKIECKGCHFKVHPSNMEGGLCAVCLGTEDIPW